MTTEVCESTYRNNTELRFVIEPARDRVGMAEAAYVREAVFGHEWKLRIPSLPTGDGTEMLTLIARAEPQSEPVAVLTVMETTGNHELHRPLRLFFPEGARIARYTQLAVLKPYRGLNIPLRLVLEAHRRFVLPKRIDYTWLLFDAERARSSSFCRLLGFRANPGTFNTEYGCSSLLIRNEGFAHYSSGYEMAPRPAVRRVVADEWVAQ